MADKQPINVTDLKSIKNAQGCQTSIICKHAAARIDATHGYFKPQMGHSLPRYLSIVPFIILGYGASPHQVMALLLPPQISMLVFQIVFSVLVGSGLEIEENDPNIEIGGGG